MLIRVRCSICRRRFKTIRALLAHRDGHDLGSGEGVNGHAALYGLDTSGCDPPRVLCDAYTVVQDEATAAAAGALWKLELGGRHLDANIIRLQNGVRITPHLGPDLEVLVFVIAGTGGFIRSAASVPLHPGHLVWMLRRAERSFHAGPDGLSYLTVHPRRPTLQIAAAG